MLLLISIPLFIWRIDYKMDGDHFTFCLFKNITGLHCYGCGLLRGVSALLHLDFKWVYTLNRLNIITIPLLLFVYGMEFIKCYTRLFEKKKPLIISG